MAGPDLVKELIRHRDVLMGFVLALTRDYDVAEELFQEVAVAIVGEANRGTRPEHFLAWARGIARHRIADHYRAKARREAGEKAFHALADLVGRAFDENEITAEASHERLKHLRQCLEHLSARARTIVDLRYRDHKPLRQIAAALAWKENSVKVALAKARKALAECVGRKLRAAGPRPGPTL